MIDRQRARPVERFAAAAADRCARAACGLGALLGLLCFGCVSKSFVGTSGEPGAEQPRTFEVSPPAPAAPVASADTKVAREAVPPARAVPIAIVGEPFGQLGFSNAIVGDLDGDGFDDFALADVIAASTLPRLAVYVFYGRAAPPTRLFALEADAILRPMDTIARPLGPNIGADLVRALGDINGDGLADFGVEGLGWFPVVLGNRTRLAGNVVALDVAVRWNAAADPLPLPSVQGAGDVNGDGFDDLVINVAVLPAATGGAAGPGAGLEHRSYLVRGHPDPWTSEEFEPTTGIATAQFIDAAATGANAGAGRGATFAVPAGDMDGDGYCDLFVVFGDPPLLSGLFYGGPARLVGMLRAEQADATLLTWAGPLPDLDGDGRSELAWIEGDAIHVRYGSAQRLYGVPQLVADFTLQAEPGSSVIGLMLAVGDIDGDGLPNLIAADPAHSVGGVQTGVVYAIRGRDERLQGSQRLDPTQAILYGQARRLADAGESGIDGDRLGYGLASGGDINGDGSEDVLVGAPTSDGLDTVGGTVFLIRGSERPPQ